MQIINGKEVFTAIEELVDPKYTSLLLIDLQNDFSMPGGYYDTIGMDLSGFSKIIPKVKVTLEAARRAGILIIHVQMTESLNFLSESPVSLRMQFIRASHLGSETAKTLPSRCLEGTWGWQIIDELMPLPKEVVIKKHRNSAFVGTDLDMILKSNGIKSVVIAGVVTQGCVLETADGVRACEYYPVLLRDCIAGYDRRLHDAAFLIMSRKNDIANSDDVLKIWS